MPDKEELAFQQNQLATYRRNLRHFLNQATLAGGEASAPLAVVNSISEQRKNIERIKKILRSWGVDVPNDDGEETAESGNTTQQTPSTPTASQQETKPLTELTPQQQLKVVNLLLACDAIKDAGSRDIVLSLLRPAITSTIIRQAQTRLDVINIVRRCTSFSGGIEELVQAVVDVEDESIPVQKLRAGLTQL